MCFVDFIGKGPLMINAYHKEHASHYKPAFLNISASSMKTQRLSNSI